jgi:hypothetical protein
MKKGWVFSTSSAPYFIRRGATGKGLSYDGTSPVAYSTLHIRSKIRKETASEKLSHYWLDVKMTRKKQRVETSMALIFGTDIQSSQHNPAQRLPSFPGTPNDRKTAPAFLPPGPKLNSANTAPSNAFLAVSSSFFTCSAPTVWLVYSHQTGCASPTPPPLLSLLLLNMLDVPI